MPVVRVYPSSKCFIAHDAIAPLMSVLLGSTALQQVINVEGVSFIEGILQFHNAMADRVFCKQNLSFL